MSLQYPTPVLVYFLLKLPSSLYSDIPSIFLQPKASHMSVSTFIFLFSNSILPSESAILNASEGFTNQEIAICREHIASVSKQEAESTVSSVTANMKIGFLLRSVASSVSGKLSWLRSTSHQCCRYLTATLSTLSHRPICGAPNFV